MSTKYADQLRRANIVHVFAGQWRPGTVIDLAERPKLDKNLQEIRYHALICLKVAGQRPANEPADGWKVDHAIRTEVDVTNPECAGRMEDIRHVTRGGTIYPYVGATRGTAGQPGYLVGPKAINQNDLAVLRDYWDNEGYSHRWDVNVALDCLFGQTRAGPGDPPEPPLPFPPVNGGDPDWVKWDANPGTYDGRGTPVMGLTKERCCTDDDVLPTEACLGLRLDRGANWLQMRPDYMPGDRTTHQFAHRKHFTCPPFDAATERLPENAAMMTFIETCLTPITDVGELNSIRFEDHAGLAGQVRSWSSIYDRAAIRASLKGRNRREGQGGLCDARAYKLKSDDVLRREECKMYLATTEIVGSSYLLQQRLGTTTQTQDLTYEYGGLMQFCDNGDPAVAGECPPADGNSAPTNGKQFATAHVYRPRGGLLARGPSAYRGVPLHNGGFWLPRNPKQVGGQTSVDWRLRNAAGEPLESIAEDDQRCPAGSNACPKCDRVVYRRTMGVCSGWNPVMDSVITARLKNKVAPQGEAALSEVNRGVVLIGTGADIDGTLCPDKVPTGRVHRGETYGDLEIMYRDQISGYPYSRTLRIGPPPEEAGKDVQSIEPIRLTDWPQGTCDPSSTSPIIQPTLPPAPPVSNGEKISISLRSKLPDTGFGQECPPFDDYSFTTYPNNAKVKTFIDNCLIEITPNSPDSDFDLLRDPNSAFYKGITDKVNTWHPSYWWQQNECNKADRTQCKLPNKMDNCQGGDGISCRRRGQGGICNAKAYKIRRDAHSKSMCRMFSVRSWYGDALIEGTGAVSCDRTTCRRLSGPVASRFLEMQEVGGVSNFWNAGNPAAATVEEGRWQVDPNDFDANCGAAGDPLADACRRCSKTAYRKDMAICTSWSPLMNVVVEVKFREASPERVPATTNVFDPSVEGGTTGIIIIGPGEAVEATGLSGNAGQYGCQGPPPQQNRHLSLSCSGYADWRKVEGRNVPRHGYGFNPNLQIFFPYASHSARRTGCDAGGGVRAEGDLSDYCAWVCTCVCALRVSTGPTRQNSSRRAILPLERLLKEDFDGGLPIIWRSSKSTSGVMTRKHATLPYPQTTSRSLQAALKSQRLVQTVLQLQGDRDCALLPILPDWQQTCRGKRRRGKAQLICL